MCLCKNKINKEEEAKHEVRIFGESLGITLEIVCALSNSNSGSYPNTVTCSSSAVHWMSKGVNTAKAEVRKGCQGQGNNTEKVNSFEPLERRLTSLFLWFIFFLWVAPFIEIKKDNLYDIRKKKKDNTYEIQPDVCCEDLVLLVLEREKKDKLIEKKDDVTTNAAKSLNLHIHHQNHLLLYIFVPTVRSSSII